MHSLSDPGRSGFAPGSSQEQRASGPLIRRMVVEDYVPVYAQQFAESTPPASPRTRGIRTPVRLVAGMVVVGLHAGLVGWLCLSSPGTMRAKDPLPLVLLDLAPAASQHVSSPIDVPPARLQSIEPPAATAPTWILAAPPPTEIAIAVSASTDVLISDANAREIRSAYDRCRRELTPIAKSTNSGAEVTLLVRVEKDGRVSDSRVEAGSGAERIDQAAQHCLQAYGLLSPQRVDGAPVLSWQRVHWQSPPPGGA